MKRTLKLFTLVGLLLGTNHTFSIDTESAKNTFYDLAKKTIITGTALFLMDGPSSFIHNPFLSSDLVEAVKEIFPLFIKYTGGLTITHLLVKILATAYTNSTFVNADNEIEWEENVLKNLRDYGSTFTLNKDNFTNFAQYAVIFPITLGAGCVSTFLYEKYSN